MKILYLGDFGDPSFEGLITILNKLKNYFRARYDLIINKMSVVPKADVINVHSSGFYAAIKYRKIKHKIIYSLHSDILVDPLRILYDHFFDYFFLFSMKQDKIPLFDRFIKFSMKTLSAITPVFVKLYFLKKMDVVVVPHEFMAKKMKMKNIKVIQHGVDVDRFRKIKAGSSKKIRVRYIGHPHPSKGFVEVVKAFSKLDEKIFDKAIFPTKKHDKMLSFVRRYDKTINIYGLLDNIIEEYNKTDILVLPYRHEAGAIATPLVLLEAMACECAIITSYLQNTREICEDSVIYVKPYDFKDVINKIKYLAKRPELRKKLGKKARQRVVKNYDQRKMFKNYENLYNDIRKLRVSKP